MTVIGKQVAVKDSEREITQKRALGLVREAELRVEKEKYEKYLDYVKKFAVEKLKKTEYEVSDLSADEIRAIDFLMAPRAKRTLKIYGLANLAYISGVTALAILESPLIFSWLIVLLFNFNDDAIRKSCFLKIRRAALEYLKLKESKTED